MLWLFSERFRVEDFVRGETAPTLGVLAIMKNEALNVREWVDHYRWQGADHIFLIDNGSTDEGRARIQADIDSGFVHYFWRPERHKQTVHYREVYDAARIDETVEWLCVADLDEFWYSPLGTLKDALRRLENEADLIYSRWRVFGSSAHVDHPPSLRRCLLQRHPAHAQQVNTKWICRTNRIVHSAAIGIHRVRWFDSRRVYLEEDLLRLNHYVTQSLAYFTQVKMTRGDASSTGDDAVRNMAYFDRYNEAATLRDTELADMLAS